jgi:hypothetical protein
MHDRGYYLFQDFDCHVFKSSVRVVRKEQGGHNKGSSPPLSSSPPSPQPPDGSDVQSARGLAPIAGVQPPTPRQLAHCLR